MGNGPTTGNSNLTTLIGSKTGVRIGLLCAVIPAVIYCVSVFYGVRTSIDKNTESIDRMANETKKLNARLEQHLKDPSIHHRAIDKIDWRLGRLEKKTP